MNKLSRILIGVFPVGLIVLSLAVPVNSAHSGKVWRNSTQVADGVPLPPPLPPPPKGSFLVA